MGSKRDGHTNPLGSRPNVLLPDQDSTASFTVRRDLPTRKIVVLTLRVVAGRDMLRYVTLNNVDSVTIGRDENGGLVLSDASVSRRHARITCTADGAVTVEDLHSTNGTAVNGHPVDTAALHPGDHLEIGTVSLRLDLLSLEEVDHLHRVLERLEANNRDPLTGLLNRAWLDDDFPTLQAQAALIGVDYACLFVDIDNFKSVNDRFGHQVGDDVLVGVARLLMVGVRETDACVRYGGEELLMLLHGSDESAAFEVAERVRRAIENHDWSRTNPGLQVTASFGVAGPIGGEAVKEQINRADRALYAAKAAGRNRAARASTLS
ncbi:MAG: GGDEF domain-containing protein [Pseudomonadota bacterium]|nr:GGDEF domain-containing protein [Pseudomonadota bacterium]